MTRMNDKIGWKEVYDLVDDKVGEVASDVSEIKVKVANIEGRLMMIPILISSGIGVFFFIINLVIAKK
jgi:hypothetical protein